VLAYVVAAVGLVVALVGGAVLLVPLHARRVMRWSQTDRFLHVAVAARILMGAFLIAASQACAWPMAVGTVGVLVLAAGLAGALIGMVRLRALMGWFVAQSDGLFRVAGGCAIVFGVFLAYAAI